MANNYSTLEVSSVSFNNMIQRYGVVTVMNANVYDVKDEIYAAAGSKKSVGEILALYNKETAICTLDTLKIANVTIEGPDKTVTGGQYSNPLIKFGKTARLEMQDALGNAFAIAALGGGVVEAVSDTAAPKVGPDTSGNYVLHMTETFGGPKTIIGDSFFIDQKTGAQVPVKIIFYQFLPDSITNLSQDSEGDATVFDMNGDLLTTVIKMGDSTGKLQETGVFYSICSAKDGDVAEGAPTDAAA